MLDFIFICKQKIIKYKKQLFTFALVPVFFFASSLSSFAAVSPDLSQEWFLIPFNSLSGSDTTGSFDADNGVYNDSATFSGDWPVFSVSKTQGGVFPKFQVGHRYLVYMTISARSNEQFTVNRAVFRQNKDDANINVQLNNIISSSSVYTSSTTTVTYFFDVSPLSDVVLSTASAAFVNLNKSINFTGRLSWAFYGLDITDSSESEVNQIVTAINNQTNNIMNAGSGFGGTTSGILSGNDALSGYIDDYTQVEQSMYDKFTENQTAVIGDFSSFSWGSLSTAVDWTSDYLNRIYDNSGDFRTMFMYPILAGIALIFIGRQGLTAYVRSRREK